MSHVIFPYPENCLVEKNERKCYSQNDFICEKYCDFIKNYRDCPWWGKGPPNSQIWISIAYRRSSIRRTLEKTDHSYHLMQEGFTDFCDDNFLIDSSEQDTETDCLLHCESTGDPGKCSAQHPTDSDRPNSFGLGSQNGLHSLDSSEMLHFSVIASAWSLQLRPLQYRSQNLFLSKFLCLQTYSKLRCSWKWWSYQRWLEFVAIRILVACHRERMGTWMASQACFQIHALWIWIFGHSWRSSASRILKICKSMEDDLKRILDSRKEMEERGKHGHKDELWEFFASGLPGPRSFRTLRTRPRFWLAFCL